VKRRHTIIVQQEKDTTKNDGLVLYVEDIWQNDKDNETKEEDK
jgi:hypothetical protein